MWKMKLFWSFDLCFIIFQTIIHDTHCQTTCTTVGEWVGNNLTAADNFFCRGYQCCAHATIWSTLSSGQISCNAARSCIHGNLKTVPDADLLACGGYLGCAFTSSIQSYVGNGFVLIDNLLMYNYKTCLSKPFVFVWFELKQYTLIGGNESRIHLRGEFSGAGGKSMVAVDGQLICYAGLSCVFSDIIGNDILLEGYFSGGYSNIYGHDTIMNVYFYGYLAGYGATLHCKDGQTCIIHCSAAGCLNLNLNCSNNANCTVADCDDWKIICPNSTIMNSNDFNNTDWVVSLAETINYPNLIVPITGNVNDIVRNYRGNDSNCDIICDDSQECQSGTLTYTSNNSKICLTGHESGKSGDITATGMNSTVICDGGSSCVTADIVATNVYAGAHASLLGANVKFEDVMVISGQIAANSGKIKSGKYLVLLTTLAGDKANVSGVDNIYSLAGRALDEMQIYSAGKNTSLYTMAYSDESLGYIKGDFYCNNGDICSIYCINQDVCNTTITFHCDYDNCMFYYYYLDSPQPSIYPSMNCSKLFLCTMNDFSDCLFDF